MQQPERNSRPSGHDHHEHHHVSQMDQPSPMNMLWSLILALLTFLLIVICVLSINWITKLSSPDSGEENPPATDHVPSEPPVMLPSATQPTWSPDAPEETITFTSNAAFEHFSHVTVNGATVDPSCYVVSEGSTVVTLRAEYLAALPAGTYEIGIHSENGTAKASFVVKATTPIGPDPGPGEGGNEKPSFIMRKDPNTVQLKKKVMSDDIGVFANFAIVVDLSDNRIVAELNGDEKIDPASMTKILTLLVACENLTAEDLKQYVIMDEDIVLEMQRENASGVGFKAGEELTVEALLYAVAVESDCAASIQLARYVSGSHEAFVQKMNDKCREMGLVSSHFTNATGLYAEDHKTTCREMASIMAAAMANEQVKALLSAKEYVTTTNVHGRLTFKSTYFCDVVEEYRPFTQVNPSHGQIFAAKTGWLGQGQACLATCMQTTASGKNYVVITAKGFDQLQNLKDHVALYEDYCR